MPHPIPHFIEPMHFFDTLLFAETMKESGMPEKTAKALAEELKKLNEANQISLKQDAKEEALKTREDMQNKALIGESRIEQKISVVEKKISEVDNKVIALEQQMHQEFKLVRSENKTSEQRIISEIKSATLIIVLGLGTVITLVQKFV